MTDPNTAQNINMPGRLCKEVKRSPLFALLIAATLSSFACSKTPSNLDPQLQPSAQRALLEWRAPRREPRALEAVIIDAGNGSVESQSELAERYAMGLAAPKDEAESVRWLTEAARHGNANAQFRVASRLLHDPSLPIPERNVTVLDLYTKAAEGCSAEAQAALASLYREGSAGYDPTFAVKPDPALALKWGDRAARSGQSIAMAEHGLALLKGDGVARNAIDGLAWRYVGGALGFGEDYVRKFAQTEKALPKADIAAAQTRALEILASMRSTPCRARTSY